MTFERTIAQLFRMDDETWLRHANPWSGMLRLTAFPALIIAFWSRAWLGGWAIIPCVIALLWTWFNPRIFPKPRSLDHWMSRGTLGERVWLNRDTVPVPVHHRIAPNILSAVAASGLLFVVWGVLVFDPWPTLFGVMLAYMGKLWFVDRMAWLWEDMKDAAPEYRAWRAPQ